jgi:hypothetical protein
VVWLKKPKMISYFRDYELMWTQLFFHSKTDFLVRILVIPIHTMSVGANEVMWGGLGWLLMCLVWWFTPFLLVLSSECSFWTICPLVCFRFYSFGVDSLVVLFYFIAWFFLVLV